MIKAQKKFIADLQTGDQIYIQGLSSISLGIEYVTESSYSHVVMVIRYENTPLLIDINDEHKELFGGKKDNLFVFQASGPVGRCVSIFDQRPGVEGVQLNALLGKSGYLENYGPGKMWVRKLLVPLTLEEEKSVHKFVENSCKGHIPYQQNPERLLGACWFSVTKKSWFSPTSSLNLTQKSYFCSELIIKTLQQVHSLKENLHDVAAHDYAPSECETLLLNEKIITSDKTAIYKHD